MVTQIAENERFTTEVVDFHTGRSTGIGGSDAPAVVGLSKWKSPYAVYLDKLGLSEKSDASEQMEIGTAMEPVIAKLYHDRTGRDVVVPSVLYRSKKAPFMIGHLDGLSNTESGIIGLEFKNTRGLPATEWGESGTDEVPEAYIIQCQHYMAVTGLNRFDLAALIGGSELRIYHIIRNDALIENMVELERRFWNDHVLAQVAPPIDGSKAATEWIKKTMRADDGTVLQADDYVTELASQLKIARAISANAELQQTEVENKIKAIMDKASVLEGKGFKITWKKAKDSQSVDYKAIAEDLIKRFLTAENAAELITKHTTAKEGSRRFLPKFSDEEK